MTAITWLFVPGSRPDRFAKAMAAGADRVIFDWEDAVAPEDKGAARDAVADFLRSTRPARAHVRVNGLDTEHAAADTAALVALCGVSALTGVVVAKAEDPVALRALAVALGPGVEITALIESAIGIQRAHDIASVVSVTRLALGGLDLAVDLDAAAGSAVMNHAMASVVVASRAAECEAPIASPPTEIHDTAAVATAARLARANGFGGQLCIHPAQLAAVTDAFAPTDEEREWARRVLVSSGAAAQVDGHMVDKPVRDRAARILSRVRSA